jgi:hypothetical protein
MCSPAAVPTTLANSIGNCSALRSKSIWLAMLGALSSDPRIAHCSSDPLNQVPAKNQAYVPKKLRLTAHLSPRVSVATGGMPLSTACMSFMSQDHQWAVSSR